jgi:hypothetical protein
MPFFRKSQPPQQDGQSEETAFRFPRCGSGQAIAMEYQIMEKLFGREGSDWRVLDRLRWSAMSGREFEKFILETRRGRQIVHFDITEVLDEDDPAPVQAVLDAAMDRAKKRTVTITLPKPHFAVLFQTLDQVGAQLSNEQFNSDDVLIELVRTAEDLGGLAAVDEVPVRLSIADWLHIGSIISSVGTQNLAAQEILNDLRAYIQGALKAAGPE